MRRSARHLLLAVSLAIVPCRWGEASDHATASPHDAIVAMLGSFERELHDPADRAALTQLTAVFATRGVLLEASDSAWILLTFNRDGVLADVTVNAERILSAPPVIQHAVLLHELEHVKSSAETRRRLRVWLPPREQLLRRSSAFTATVSTRQPSAGVEQGSVDRERAARQDTAARAAVAARVQGIVRVLIDDEARAYERDIGYVAEAVRAAGGMDAYATRLPERQREPFLGYYRQHVAPFLTSDGAIDAVKLRRDFIFLDTFPRRYPRYYEAALMWEALQGHADVRLSADHIWRPARVLAPERFLAWLLL